MRRVLRRRDLRQMDLMDGRDRCERDRHAERHHEGQESQTWSHCNSPPGTEARDYAFPIVSSWWRRIRERTHTGFVKARALARIANASTRQRPPAQLRRRASPARLRARSRRRPFASNGYRLAAPLPARRVAGSCRHCLSNDLTVSSLGRGNARFPSQPPLPERNVREHRTGFRH